MFMVRIHPVDVTEVQILDDLSHVIDTLSFSTQLNGGFASCGIVIGSQFWHAYRYLEDRLLHRLVVSEAGMTLFEGRIVDVEAEPGQLRIESEGYWGHGQDVFMDLLYPSRGNNLVQNPSLESVTGTDWDNWTEIPGDGTIDDETTLVADGEHAVKFTNGGAGLPSLSQAVTVETSTKYELSFYTRGDGTYCGRYAIDDMTNGWILASTDTGITGTAYNYVTYEFTTSGTCNQVGIWLIGPSTSSGVAYFDRVALKKVLETTITDVVEDAIDLTSCWDQSKMYIDIDNLGTMILNSGGDGLDYDMDWHINEVIEDALQYGTSETPPRPLYFAVWEDRKCYMFPRPKMEEDTGETNIKWHIHMHDLAGGQQGLVTGRDGTKLGNKIATVYSSGQGQRSITSETSDASSIAKYGTIQKRLSISGSVEGVAEAFRDIALEENKEPRQSIRALIDGNVWRAGCRAPVYHVRAGDLIRLHLDPRADYSLSSDSQVRVLFVTSTEYDASTGRMSMSFETTATTLDILVSWMGLQGARLF